MVKLFLRESVSDANWGTGNRHRPEPGYLAIL
jgi:hypothetical protein